MKLESTHTGLCLAAEAPDDEVKWNSCAVTTLSSCPPAVLLVRHKHDDAAPQSYWTRPYLTTHRGNRKDRAAGTRVCSLCAMHEHTALTELR